MSGGVFEVFNEFKAKDQGALFRIIDSALDAINSAVLTAVGAAGSLASKCPEEDGGPPYCFFPNVRNIGAAAREGRLLALQIDKNKVYPQLAQMLHKQQIELLRVSLQASIGEDAAQIYDIITMIAENLTSAPFVGEQVKKIKGYLTFAVPELLRAGWIDFLYQKAVGTSNGSNVAALMTDPAFAAANTYDAAISYIKSKYGKTGSTPGSKTPGASTGKKQPFPILPGRGGRIATIRPDLFTPGLINIAKEKQGIPAVPPSGGGGGAGAAEESDNTLLYVGGAVAIGLVAYLALSK